MKYVYLANTFMSLAVLTLVIYQGQWVEVAGWVSGLCGWTVALLESQRRGDNQSSNYLRGYQDGTHGRTFKRDKETY